MTTLTHGMERGLENVGIIVGHWLHSYFGFVIVVVTEVVIQLLRESFAHWRFLRSKSSSVFGNAKNVTLGHSFTSPLYAPR